MPGSNSQQNWKTEKSAGKNMMNGDTNIRHLIHPDIMQKFPSQELSDLLIKELE